VNKLLKKLSYSTIHTDAVVANNVGEIKHYLDAIRERNLYFPVTLNYFDNRVSLDFVSFK